MKNAQKLDFTMSNRIRLGMTNPKLPAVPATTYTKRCSLTCVEPMNMPIAVKKLAEAAKITLANFEVTTQQKGAIMAFFSPREQLITFDAVGKKENIDIFSKYLKQSIDKYNYNHTTAMGNRTKLSGPSGAKLLKSITAEAAKNDITIEAIEKTRERLSFFKHTDHVSFTPYGTRAELQNFRAALVDPNGEIQKLLIHPIKSIHDAAIQGTLHNLPKEIITEENLNSQNNEGTTVFHLAARYGHLDQIPTKFLNEANLLKNAGFFDVGSSDSALLTAAYYGHLDQIPKELLTEKNLLAKNPDGISALNLASDNEHLDQLLVQFSSEVRELVGDTWWEKTSLYCEPNPIRRLRKRAQTLGCSEYNRYDTARSTKKTKIAKYTTNQIDKV